MKLAALGGRSLEGVGYHLHGNLAGTHLVLQLTDALTGLLRNHSQRVEAGVNHLQQVLAHQLARARHLGEGQRQRVELLGVAHRDVTYLAQYGHHLLRLDIEAEQGLRPFRQILHHHRSVHGKTPDVAEKLATLGRAGKGLKRDLQGFNLAADIHDFTHEACHLVGGKQPHHGVLQTFQGAVKASRCRLRVKHSLLQVSLHQKLYSYWFHAVTVCYTCKLLWKNPSTSSPASS